MRVNPLFSQAEVEAELREGVRRKIKAITRDLQYAGEEIVTEARTGAKTLGKDYKTQTGNLRSSIGYIITYQGEKIAIGGFTPIAGGEEGAEKGREVATQLATEESDPDTLKLTVVAGMDYASPLSAKGYDVLDTAELIAQDKTEEIKRIYKL